LVLGVLTGAFAAAWAAKRVEGTAALTSYLRGVPLLGHRPALAARALAAGDAALAAALVVAPAAGLVVALVVLVGATAIVVHRALFRGQRTMDCGCFGGGRPVAWTSIVARNGALVLLCVVALLDLPSDAALAQVVIGLGVVAGVALARGPRLRRATVLHPTVLAGAS
jgi:hypothetical protein